MLNTEKIVVLNVDDYEAGRYATTRVLQQAGFEVVEAENGEEALRLATRERPDLVVLDVNLPDVDGFEVCRRIKAQPDTTDIPVLYLSAAYRSSEHRVQGLDLGADGYLTQPIDPRELVATVNALLRARHVRDAVRENEERFRALLEATSDIIWTTDARGQVVVELPDWSAFTGQSWAEYGGAGWMDAIHPDERAAARARWAAAVEAGTLYEAEYRLRRADGSYRYTAVRAVPVLDPDGSVREWVGANTDITERKIADEELRERTERLQFLSDAATHLLLTDDPSEYVARLFDQLSAYLELDVYLHYRLEEEDATLRLDSYRGLEPDHVDAFRTLRLGESISGRAAEDRRPQVLEEIQESADEGTATLRAAGLRAYAAFPLLSDEQLIGTLAFGTRVRTCFDVDEISLMQTVCNQVAVAVERARLVDALQERAHALEEANRAKADFLATMSHELRTPLNAMIGYTDLLLLGVPAAIPTAAQEQVDRIRSAAVHLTQLIEEVLTHARIEAGRDELHLEEIATDELLVEVSSLVEPLAHQKGLRFTIDRGTYPERLYTDPRKVRQILVNLLGNAVKFTDRGEVSLGVRAEGDTLLLKVTDTGIGIAPENLERIFEPFWQVDRTKTRRAGGTGLGLGVVQQLAQRLGGQVRVESREGRGSIFVVALPLARPAAG